MRAILIKDGKGPLENLYIGETAMPTLRSQEVLVKARNCRAPSKRAPSLTITACKSRQIAAFGLNRMDISQRKGQYPLPPGASEVLGVEFSGHIAALGPNMSANCQWAIGDEVLGLTSGVSRHQQKAGRPTD
jgi:NADPH:quinone reductase-like Zn-dependent oxidoreductase